VFHRGKLRPGPICESFIIYAMIKVLLSVMEEGEQNFSSNDGGVE